MTTDQNWTCPNQNCRLHGLVFVCPSRCWYCGELFVLVTAQNAPPLPTNARRAILSGQARAKAVEVLARAVTGCQDDVPLEAVFQALIQLQQARRDRARRAQDAATAMISSSGGSSAL